MALDEKSGSQTREGKLLESKQEESHRLFVLFALMAQVVGRTRAVFTGMAVLVEGELVVIRECFCPPKCNCTIIPVSRTYSEFDQYWQPGQRLPLAIPHSPVASSTPRQRHQSPPSESLVDMLHNFQDSMETQFRCLSSRLGKIDE